MTRIDASTAVEAGQKWWHRRDDRTVEVESSDSAPNGFVSVTNVATGRTSRLRKSTLAREYQLVAEGVKRT